MQDIGKFRNNEKFYMGFEGEKEVTLIIKNHSEYNIHIYGGYFYDIFGEPTLDGKGWNGFTRDYNQLERTFDDFSDSDYIIVNDNIKEYLNDLLSYSDKKFEDEESSECFKLLCEFLKYALANGFDIQVHVF